MPLVSSCTTKPLQGTVWFTATGVTHRSPTGDSVSSSRVRYLTIGLRGVGSSEKSGHSVSLKTAVRSALTTGSRLEIVSGFRSEEHTSELQSRRDLVCRLLLEKKK